MTITHKIPYIAVIDDDPYISEIIVKILEGADFKRIKTFLRGFDFLEEISKYPTKYSVVLCDIKLPDIHGLDLVTTIKSFNDLTQVIIITGYGSMDSAKEAIRLGISDYISKPFLPEEILLSITKCVEKYLLLVENKKFSECITTLSDEYKDLLESSNKKLMSILDSLTIQMTELINFHDPACHNHQLRTSKIVDFISDSLGFCILKKKNLTIAALFHDVGKYKIPSSILLKSEPLSIQEREIINLHPIYGYEFVEPIFGTPIATYIQQHHERLDGSGYPRGISGADYLFGSQILSIADTLESMTSVRPWRPAVSTVILEEYLKTQGRSLFDQSLVDKVISILDIIPELSQM